MFLWLNRKVYVSHGNFIMTARDSDEPEIIGNPGGMVLSVVALDPVRLVIHTTEGRFIQHGDPHWPGSAMRRINPHMEKYA